MDNSNLILVDEFCVLHEIESTFISDLKNYGLITVVLHEADEYLDHDQLPLLEKLIRLHYDLQVNMEGIDIIYNLLEKIETLQSDLIQSQNKLRRFESHD